MSYVYLIECQQFYKIGIANDVESRIAQLSTGNPFPLKLIASYRFANAQAVETVLHQRFANSKKRAEWFDLGETAEHDFREICQLLGGDSYLHDKQPTEEQIQDANDFQDEIFDESPKRGRPLSESWRLEFAPDPDNPNIIRARLRKGGGEKRKGNFISLGTIEDVYNNNPEWRERCLEYSRKTGYVLGR